ncbi:tol-pal system protein YbgF [Blochmannia endosymbiont of Camponotus sp.]|uniref:tol-pal system protein YbgF n=1 Tax=Blochmannia endosymbiont of Camponotus sp. TaxID=700220 RepID=UPI0020252A32|nr:tol-pal system protein YbgF [Blochmannia endosymbiont of Camponotus sp.]URJ23675.1 tol-pal system protein YbgF [Blochmannia endosymbiont of Camponotus sp.]URJ25565.1 tol-pal system protein YbgF [Blochmannia endosymbiont of Camponotus sp.]
MIKFILFLCKLDIIIILIIHFNIINNNIVYAKDVNHKIDSNQRINQLHQIYDAHSQCLIQMQQQLSENQRDIDILRGHIQDIQHRISEIIDNQLASQHTNNIPNKHNNTRYSNNIPDKLSSYSNIQKSQKINNATIIDVDTAYKQAVSLVLEKKQYNQAIEAFQNFIKNHPESIYQSNSHYWLGQLYYNKGNKHDAAHHFALVVKNFPKSLKASDALLKIGIIMQETEQKDKAKTIYKQVGKLYPNSTAAKQAQKRLIHLS